jgi:ABC-type branched-subunit amino acid transport system substrate-binding protein
MKLIVVGCLAQFLGLTLPALQDLGQDRKNGSEAVARGKEIYLNGTGNGAPIEAYVGEPGIKVPASVLRCANCHGPDGRGKPEGGIHPSNIRWTELSKPYAISASSGRQRPPYTEGLVVRAVTMGIDSGGNRLDVAMPKYQLTRQQANDLVAYLKALDTITDPGITDQVIKVGVLLPPETTLSGMNRAVRETLAAEFQRVNDIGGLYGRRIQCVFSDTSETESGESFRKFIREEQPFALVESFIAGSEREIGTCLEQNGIPLVGAISLFPDLKLNRYAFYLFPGVPGQGEALARFTAGRQGTKAACSLIIYSDEEGIRSAIDRITSQVERCGWNCPQTINVAHRPDWSALLRDGKIDAVFWLAPGEYLENFFAAAVASQEFPMVLAPGAFVGREIYRAPRKFAGRLFLSFPILPSDQTQDGEKEFLALADAGRFSEGDFAERFSALSAAKLLIHGLQQAGREVTREKLIEIFDTTYRFDTGQTPPLTFNPNRRIGANGVHVIEIDLEKNQLILPAAWIELESP